MLPSIIIPDTIINYIVLYAAQDQCRAPYVKPNSVGLDTAVGPFPVGTVLTYTCREGYIGGGSITYYGIWTYGPHCISSGII